MSNLNQDLVMEATHGRKSKCKTEFKAVMNKVLVSGLVLATILGSTTPAFAANLSIQDTMDGYKSGTITQEYGVNVESAIQNIQNTIAAINTMRANGSVSETKIKELATQLYSLETAVKSSGDGVTAEVENVVLEAEKAISDLSNATEAEVAVAVVKASLGIADSVSVENTKAASVAVSSFSDVPSSHWAYKNIMAMTSKGLFSGTTTPINGVGTFAPDKTMTRAEFVTVVMRAMYADELNAMPKVGAGEAW